MDRFETFRYRDLLAGGEGTSANEEHGVGVRLRVLSHDHFSSRYSHLPHIHRYSSMPIGTCIVCVDRVPYQI